VFACTQPQPCLILVLAFRAPAVGLGLGVGVEVEAGAGLGVGLGLGLGIGLCVGSVPCGAKGHEKVGTTRLIACAARACNQTPSTSGEGRGRGGGVPGALQNGRRGPLHLHPFVDRTHTECVAHCLVDGVRPSLLCGVASGTRTV
jgi:hypothetical protein